jgi:hypothetical protein
MGMNSWLPSPQSMWAEELDTQHGFVTVVTNRDTSRSWHAPFKVKVRKLFFFRDGFCL